jgi:hypothetical protein
VFAFSVTVELTRTVLALVSVQTPACCVALLRAISVLKTGVVAAQPPPAEKDSLSATRQFWAEPP